MTSVAEKISVFDDVLADVEAYRVKALAQPFGDVTLGTVTFHGIAPIPDRTLIDRLIEHFGAIGDVTTFLRLSPKGQEEPNFIHTDVDMGAWTGIYYMTSQPVKGDGTTFWRDKQTGDIESQSVSMTEGVDWRDLDRWEPWHTVEARSNRLVMFPAQFYHSRAIFDNYGETPDESRLIQVLFGGEYVRRN